MSAHAEHVTCNVCPRACTIAPGQVGACRARSNEDGALVCANYGHATSLALDPVEKKPLAMWESGKTILSVGSYGCNLSCPFCQNHTIAQVGQAEVAWRSIDPIELVSRALKLKDHDCIGIAFTYNEPLVGYEYVVDASTVAHEAGLKTALVTNGVAHADIFDSVLKHIDAVNIDLKGFSSSFYKACGMKDAFEVVKRNIAAAADCATCHLEVTSLIVPGLSDKDEMKQASLWLASLDSAIPYHVSQYHPAFMYTQRSLPNREVQAYADQARIFLDNVFTGNM